MGKLLLSIYFVLSCCALNAQSVANSIIPLVEQIESLNNLSPSKYSKIQFAEIEEALSHKEDRIRLATYNMLFNLYDHNLDENNRWPHRFPCIVELLQEMQLDIIGVQEPYPDQIDDLLASIGDEFAFYAKPCQDGELSGIFYRKDRFGVVEGKIWYMTNTPDIPSSETLTMLQLKDLKTGRLVAIANTHLAFSKVDKRDFQARFIAKTLEPLAQQMPVIFMGDLNTFPNRPDLGKLPFYDGDYIHRILTQGSLRDAKEMSLLGHVGPISTFTTTPDGISPFQGTGTPGVMLDHIYVSKEITVLLQAVQPGTVEGNFPSDHMPLIIDFLIY